MTKSRVKSREVTPEAEILVVGNEILIGHTLDTNSHWIAQRLREHGWYLGRITTVRDELSAIASSIRESLGRRPNLIFTLGGLGPTPDDMTVRGVALGLRMPLRLNRQALEMIKEFYRRMGRGEIEMTPSRRKMALLPSGALVLQNTVGTAPGVMIKKGRTAIVSLPGVPREMMAIFQDSVIPILRETGGQAPTETTLRIDGIVESALAPILALAKRRYQLIYFKSHPRSSEITGRPRIELHIYSLSEVGRQTLGEAASFVVEELAKIGRSRMPTEE